MRIADMSRRGLAMLRDGLGSPTFVWKGAEIPCVPNSVATQADPGLGGFDMSIGIRIFIDAREFFSVDTTAVTVDSNIYTADDDRPVPVSGKLCGYNGQTYRIESARLSPDKAFVVIALVDRKK